MKLHQHTCQNPACGSVFERREKNRLYCCTACAIEVNRSLIRGTRTGKRKATSGVKRGKRIYALSGL